MQVKDLLTAGNVMTAAARSKHDVLRAMAEHASTELGLPVGDVLKPLLQREALGSTGIGGGVALPHARLATVSRPYGQFALLDKSVEFGASDDKPVDVVFLLLLPADASDQQLTSLACIARRLKRPGLLDSLRRIRDPNAIFELLVAE